MPATARFNMPRFNMVEQQVRPYDVLDPAVLAALHQLPRELFVPPVYSGVAYADTALPIGHSQTLLPPREHGRLAQSLQIKPEERVLEIGTGSGYLTALLGLLAFQGQVVSIEIFEELSNLAQKNLDQASAVLPQIPRKDIQLLVGDAAHGWDQSGLFDVIAITGSFPHRDNLTPFRALLKPAGRMFAIIGSAPVMQAIRINNTDTSQEETILYETLVAPLIHGEPAPTFVF